MTETNSKYIDLKKGLPRVGNNETLYKKLLGKFNVDIGALETALNGGEYIKAGEIVHAAKGVAANLSLAAFYDSSVTLMDQMRGGNKPDRANVDIFEQLYDETLKAIAAYLS
ncbi:MAG: Hpt domain-containing protein [Clostridiales Family XIII bacterium]|jgi:HPt (histidine-containing phosphotransfer) domain-containing protein|nr:Hpt domain-containing protein [Clostridiales Family XIII bacterium]